MPFAETHMDLEGIMLSEISQKRQILHYITYMESEKSKRANVTKKKQTHKYREQTSGYQ